MGHHARMNTRTLLIVAGSLILGGCSGSRSGTTHLKAEGALGPYSAAVLTDDFIFVSGKIGLRGDTFEVEVNTCLDGVEAELARAGATLADVVQATVYLTDLDRYAELNELYSRRMGPPYPARACIQVSRLPGDARVEIQVIARWP